MKTMNILNCAGWNSIPFKSKVSCKYNRYCSNISLSSRVMLLAAVIIVCGAAWYMNVPVPYGFSEPWSLRWDMAKAKINQDTNWLLDKTGITPLHVSMRAKSTLKNISVPDQITIEESMIEGVKVRLYKTRTKNNDTNGKPGLVFYHGGGWVVGSPERYDNAVIAIASAMDIMIISVAYRKAPEVIFPGAFEDCLKVTKYVLNNSKEFGVDSHRIAIVGGSAGGNLAAAVALRLRDENFKPMPRVQVLMYPCLQAQDFLLPSYSQNKYGPLLTKYVMSFFWSMYATGTQNYISPFLTNEHTTSEVKKTTYNSFVNHGKLDQAYLYEPYQKPGMDYGNKSLWNEIKTILMNPYFAPLMAKDFSNLPPTFVYTAHYDVLRDEGLLYVKQLTDAGVPVTNTHGAQGFHGICTRLHYKEGRECMDSVIQYLIENL